jgi:CHRD domain-containing protein
MRQGLTLASCALLALAAASCHKASDDIGEQFIARLSGANEVPARGTGANGTVGFNVTGNRVDYSIEVHGISAITGAHLHTGATGVNGPIRIALFPGPGANFTSNPISPGDGQLYEGSFEATDVVGISYSDLLAGMRAGTVYANVHTTQFPGGEMRGQVQSLP